jgi:hypothetical protein
MNDEEVDLCNACTDLVTFKKLEAFPLHVFAKRPGEWIRVQEFCQQHDLPVANLSLDLCAAWLPDPVGNDAYAIIFFYDSATMWNMVAHYHRGRLVREASQQPARQANLAAPSTPNTITSLPARPPAQG